MASPRAIDELNYKDVFRRATKHSLLEPAGAERWFAYRDNRNTTAHDYGEAFAEETLAMLPRFIADAHSLERVLREKASHDDA